MEANVVSVLLGNGDGTLQPRVDYPINAGSVAIADFNQDGKPDLAVAGLFSGGGIVGILEGNGDGTFRPAVAYHPAGLFGLYLAVGDFNGDGKLDLVITFAIFGNGTASETSVVSGNGDGTFAHATTLPTTNTGCHVGAPLVADFDGDGSTDIVLIVGGGQGGGVCGFGSGTILVFGGNGDGTFRAPATFTTTNAGDLVAAADLDGDKAPDLVTVNGVFGNSDNTISVLLNATGADFSISVSALTPGTVSRGQKFHVYRDPCSPQLVRLPCCTFLFGAASAISDLFDQSKLHNFRLQRKCNRNANDQHRFSNRLAWSPTSQLWLSTVPMAGCGFYPGGSGSWLAMLHSTKASGLHIERCSIRRVDLSIGVRRQRRPWLDELQNHDYRYFGFDTAFDDSAADR